MNDPNVWQNLLNSIKPMLFVSRMFGLLTFTYSDKGLNESKIKYIGNILALLIYTPITFYGIMIRLRHRTMVLYKTTDIIQLIVSMVYLEIAWIMSMVYQKKNIKLLNEIKNYDKNTIRTNNNIDYKRTLRYIWYNIGIRILVTIVSIAGQVMTLTYSFNTINKSMFYVVNFFPTILNSAVCLQSVTYIHLIRYRFKVLNKMIHSIVISVNTQSTGTIQSINIYKKVSGDLVKLYNICSMHHQLAKLIKLFNKTFGVTLLVMFGVSFVNIVVGLYFPCANFRSEEIDWDTVVNYLLVCLPFIMDTIYVCHGCNSTVEEVTINISNK